MRDAPTTRDPLEVPPGAPAFSEQDVKATLDHCRLTYVYEPDWTRLRGRVSRILSGGLLVAWFQGGGAAAGRAIICDPSNRWARENVNRFLRQLPVDAPLPLVTAAGSPRWHDGPSCPDAAQSVSVAGDFRTQLAGAMDRNGCVEVRALGEPDGGQLFRLLGEHYARTGVPALVAVPFCAPSEPVVWSPRDAIRTMFSLPVDLLVIERFAIAKDYWLLGMHAQ